MRSVINEVNNDVYDELGERWYTAQDDPVALLRAESRLRNPWLIAEMKREFGADPYQILDVGCGAGLLSNALAESLGESDGRVTGIDQSEESLRIARARDVSGKVRYLSADAAHLPFESGEFDAVCAMDFLEHVEDPERAIAECARVLRPGGRFFFYTFNRNFLSWLLVIKGVEWAVKNTPPGLHLHRLLIKPAELRRMCSRQGLEVGFTVGMRPKILSRPIWELFRTGVVPERLEFRFTPSLAIGYLGWARKTG